LKQEIESQTSRELKAEDTVVILKAVKLYDWQLEQNRPVL